MQQLTRRQFLESGVHVTGLAALGVGVISRESAGLESSGTGSVARLKITDPERFRILQLTDLHFFSRDKSTWKEYNHRTVEIMRKLTALTKPDLVIITGDVWSEDQGGLGVTHMRYAIRQFEDLDVPWAFTWGNHDLLPDFAVGHEAFTHAKRSLYRGANSDGNYVINIIGPDNRRIWQIVCLNTHRDGMQRAQQAWLKALAKADPGPVPRFAFFHIPLKQYAEVWANGSAIGIKSEKVSSEKEDGSTLPILKALGVKACFCGHDHYNDYSGVADGVELVYGRCSRAGGYAPENFPKGGKLITVNTKTGKYTWVSVTPDGARWRPKPGERIEFPE